MKETVKLHENTKTFGKVEKLMDFLIENELEISVGVLGGIRITDNEKGFINSGETYDLYDTEDNYRTSCGITELPYPSEYKLIREKEIK